MAVTTADTVMADPALANRLRALRRANEIRLAGTALKREVKAGRMSLASALADDRAQSLTVFDLLMAQPRWGRKRTLKVLVPNLISEGKRVRDLTDRQKRVLGGDRS